MVNENEFIHHQCLRCHRWWKSRLERPSCCPKCRRPDWDKKNVGQSGERINLNTLAGAGEDLATVPLKSWKPDGKLDGPNDVDWAYMKTKRDTILRKCRKLGIVADYQVTYTHLRVWRVL